MNFSCGKRLKTNNEICYNLHTEMIFQEIVAPFSKRNVPSTHHYLKVYNLVTSTIIFTILKISCVWHMIFTITTKSLISLFSLL